MQIRGKFIAKLLLIIVSTFQFLYAVGVTATVSNTEVVQGNPIKLHLVATGDDVEFPRIVEVNKAQILGRHKGQSSSHSYNNGNFESKYTTTLSLTFIPEKSMTIPSYTVKIDGSEYQTDPIAIKVIKASAVKSSNNRKFFLTMKTNKSSVVVGEAFVVTVYFSLQNGIRLSDNPQYTKPRFEGFFVKEVPQEQPYREGNYQVTKIQYVLTPQTKGKFTLDGASAKIGLADTSRRDMFGRFFGTNWTPIASNTLNIEVKEQPVETDLVGDFTLKSNLDQNSVKANKPVNLTITIKGEGSLEDFKFPNYEIDGVTIYSDEAKVESRLVKGMLESSATKSFVFISEEDFEIPAHDISVYNIKTSKVSHLHIPSYTVKVAPQKSLSSVTHSTDTKGHVQSNLNQKPLVKEKVVTKIVEQKSVAWWMLVLAFVLGMFSMYLLQYLLQHKGKRRQNPFKESEALKILYAHISNDARAEEMVRKLYAKKNGDKSITIDKKLLKQLVEKYKK